MTDHYTFSPITGIVLAGGNSSRMGSDKSKLCYHGTPQANWMLEMLTIKCEHTFIAVKNFKGYLSLPQLRDNPELGDIGPMNPVLTAFEQFPNHALLVVGCDYPYFDQHALESLLSHRDVSKNAVAFINESTGRPEPLLAIYEPSALKIIAREFEKGNHSLLRVLEQLDLALLHPLDANWIKSVDKPEDIPVFQSQVPA